MKQKTVEQLKCIIDKAQNELYDIEEKQREKKLRPQIGKCYRYHNSYSGDDKWWLYMKIIGYKSPFIETFSFQKDSYGKWTIHNKDTAHLLDGYQEISCDELNQAWRECLAELKTYLKS